MKELDLRRLGVTLLATIAALGSGLGCLPNDQAAFGALDFTPAFTLDRRPVELDGNGAPTEDPSAGPYRRAPGRVASLLYPDVGGAEHLLQANCFWAGRGPSGGGDLLRLNWEAYGLLSAEHDGKYLPEDDAEVSACRLDDPLTRQPKQFTAPNAPQFPTTFVRLGTAINLAHDGDELRPTSADLSFENDTEMYGVSLAAVRPAGSHPDRVCDLAAFTGPEIAISTGVWSYDGGADTAGRVAGCTGQGRRVIPAEDARFRAGLAEGTLYAEQWFDAVLVATTGERLVRPAAVQGNAAAWSVPNAAERWHENFSPSLRVEAVRLLRRRGGVDDYLDPGDLQDLTLCVRASAGATGCLYEFGADADANGDVVWRPLAPPPGGSARNLTPGYDVDLLGALDPGEIVADPLEWVAVPADPLDLLFEFTLSVVLAPIEVRVDPLTAFGRVPPGETRFRRLTVTNAGGRSVSIDSVGVTGADAADFQAVVLGDPKPVPVGVELINEERPEFWIAGDYLELPVYQLEEREQVTLLKPADLDGEAYQINGYQVRFDGPTLTHTDPAADFQPPVFTSGQTRPLNVISHRLVALPVHLAPGENLGLRVRFRASQPGEKAAQVRLEYHDPTDGTPGIIESVVVADALWGPVPSVLPGVLILDDRADSHRIRNLLLFNSGDQPLEVTDHRVLGPDAGRVQTVAGPPPPTFELGVGSDQVFTLEYLDVCALPAAPVEHAAELRLDTNAGELTVPIRMQSVAC